MQKWDGLAKRLLKAEMAKRDMSVEDLASALDALGLSQRADNLANKISRGQFTATFFLQCLLAMEVSTLRLD